MRAIRNLMVGLVMILSGSVFAQEAKTYTNEAFGFSAKFPDEVKQFSNPDGTTTFVSANKEDTIAYMIGVATVADTVLQSKPKDQILEDAVKGGADNVKGTIISKSVVSLDGYPGRQFDIKVDVLIAKCRIYLVGKRLYVVMVIAKVDIPLPMLPSEFQASFKLLPSPK